MGIILVPLYILYIWAVALVVILVYRFITASKFVMIALITMGVLLPTYDIIITNALGVYYCKTDPNPKTFIKEKVEYPESIYWEDNIFGGYDAEDRKLMIVNYLDGVHLKTMALNGKDGMVHVYTLENPMWEKIKHEFDNEKTLRKTRNKYTELIIHEEHIYTKEAMPKMNYTVTFDEVKLNSFSRKFLYSDETKIIDNSTNETIAYNRQYIRFFYNIAPELSLGNRYYDSWDGIMCASEDTQYFFKNIFKKIHINSGAIAESFNSKLYRKYKKVLKRKKKSL
jgi:hypothetical protein